MDVSDPGTAWERCVKLWNIAAVRVLLAESVCIIAFLFWRVASEKLAMEHFTYWSLIISSVGILVWLVCLFLDTGVSKEKVQGNRVAIGTMSFEQLFLVFLAGFIFGVLTLVVFLITILPIWDEKLIEAQTKGISPGVANFGNLLMHYFPPTMFLIALLLRRKKLARGFLTVFRVFEGAEKTSTAGKTSIQLGKLGWFVTENVILCVFLLAPAAFVSIYNARYDFQDAYGVTVPRWKLLGVGMLFLLVFWFFSRQIVFSLICRKL